MNEKVLIVDDEAILKGIDLNLGRFNLTTANGPEDAFREVEENGPFSDRIDVQMPGMDGASMMQAGGKHPSTLCILLMNILVWLHSGVERSTL